jgi:hypothetical protein
MKTTETKSRQIRLLESILTHTKKPCALRAALIGMIFPEFDAILSDLANLADVTEKSP